VSLTTQRLPKRHEASSAYLIWVISWWTKGIRGLYPLASNNKGISYRLLILHGSSLDARKCVELHIKDGRNKRLDLCYTRASASGNESNIDCRLSPHAGVNKGIPRNQIFVVYPWGYCDQFGIESKVQIRNNYEPLPRGILITECKYNASH